MNKCGMRLRDSTSHSAGPALEGIHHYGFEYAGAGATTVPGTQREMVCLGADEYSQDASHVHHAGGRQGIECPKLRRDVWADIPVRKSRLLKSKNDFLCLYG